MSGRQFKLFLLTLIILIAFVMGVMKLLLLRFESGDVYPIYSSLRSDPLGTQVLFESLNAVSGDKAKRNFSVLDTLHIHPGTTLLMCGLPANLGPQLCNRAWEKFMAGVEANGGRLILAFNASSARRDTAEMPSTQKGRPPCEDDASSGEDRDEKNTGGDAKTEWWDLKALGMGIERAEKKGDAPVVAEAVSRLPHPIPETLPWRGALFFELTAGNWQILYAVEGQPVIAQRPWGQGSIILLADSYLLSNEAMRSDRRPALLNWLLAGRREIIFDEFHFGLVKQPGIAGLAIKYRLHGVMGGVLLISVLLIWRQMAVFIPAPRVARSQDAPLHAGLGIGTINGLVYLMIRHISAKNLLQICCDNWETSSAASNIAAEKISEVKEIISQYAQSSSSQDPVAVYRHICRRLKQGKIL